jgi:hypothetical protein
MFMIVTYDRNESSLQSTILANLALARRVNYDRKVHSKLRRTFG